VTLTESERGWPPMPVELLGAEAFRAALARVHDAHHGGDVIDRAVEEYVKALARIAALERLLASHTETHP
jgi:hypothetical protein